jgi:hypothetical protein
MMFSEKWLREAANRTGFIKRERKIAPDVFFWVLVLGYGPFFCRGHLQALSGCMKRQEKKRSQIPVGIIDLHQNWSHSSTNA